jgi:YidC/Oxa1 family membrane protein insertase
MERNSLFRWIAIAGVGLLIYFFVWPKISGKDKAPQTFAPVAVAPLKLAPDFVPDAMEPAQKAGEQNNPVESELCTLTGNRYRAEFSGRGAGLTHFFITDAHYADDDKGFDVSTTPKVEQWRSMRTQFRAAGAEDQVAYDRFNWKLAEARPDACTYTYEDDVVSLKKTFTTTPRPFEFTVETTVTNKADAPKKHQLAISTHAFRFGREVKGKLGRVSPFMSELTCASGDDVIRKGKEDFKEGWLEQANVNRYAAITNYYFGQAIIPAAGDAPKCRVVADLLASYWQAHGLAHDDENAGAAYHAELVYPTKELAPKASVTYTQSAFFGPKERDALAGAAEGRPKLGSLINLGFFSPVAKVLVGVLLFFHKQLGNWGLAIILMTLCVRLILFPLALPGIKSSIAMRKLRPQIEAIHEKFKDDPGARGMATLELQRKNGVNMLAGCLPQLAQMPVWWAMYTTLQTAVEMYHTKFLWFSDLSAPDKYFVLPVVLGGLGLVQARIMPQQPGQDPQQQKMMMYMMPIIFTVMMLFLPAALGVYMTTNSVLGIVQALVIERVAKRAVEKETSGEIVATEVEGTPALTKGKARV